MNVLQIAQQYINWALTRIVLKPFLKTNTAIDRKYLEQFSLDQLSELKLKLVEASLACEQSEIFMQFKPIIEADIQTIQNYILQHG